MNPLKVICVNDHWCSRLKTPVSGTSSYWWSSIRDNKWHNEDKISLQSTQQNIYWKTQDRGWTQERFQDTEDLLKHSQIHHYEVEGIWHRGHKETCDSFHTFIPAEVRETDHRRQLLFLEDTWQTDVSSNIYPVSSISPTEASNSPIQLLRMSCYRIVAIYFRCSPGSIV